MCCLVEGTGQEVPTVSAQCLEIGTRAGRKGRLGSGVPREREGSQACGRWTSQPILTLHFKEPDSFKWDKAAQPN